MQKNKTLKDAIIKAYPEVTLFRSLFGRLDEKICGVCDCVVRADFAAGKVSNQWSVRSPEKFFNSFAHNNSFHPTDNFDMWHSTPHSDILSFPGVCCLFLCVEPNSKLHCTRVDSSVKHGHKGN